MRIALTGPTSLLGRNLLFEIFLHHINDLSHLELLLLGRSKGESPLRNRVKKMFMEMTPEPFSAAALDKIYGYLDNQAVFIDSDLMKDRLGISDDDFQKLASAPIDFFFHIAALTDFRDSSKIAELLKRINVDGTRKVLDLVAAIKVNEFCYVGTAYACGTTTGNLQPDYVNINQTFRNPYEHSKLQAEIRVRLFAKRTGMRCRFFRPSTIGGRLVSPPLGNVYKFDVFYDWAKFFLRIKLKDCPWEARYSRTTSMDFRLVYSLDSGLNIVPVDFAAKAMYEVCLLNDPGESYHLVNTRETPHDVYVRAMLTSLQIGNVTRVDSIPLNSSELETLYYTTAGKVYTPYVTSQPMLFDTSSTANVLAKARLHCPPVDWEHFMILMAYAKKYDFGLNVPASPQMD